MARSPLQPACSRVAPQPVGELKSSAIRMGQSTSRAALLSINWAELRLISMAAPVIRLEVTSRLPAALRTPPLAACRYKVLLLQEGLTSRETSSATRSLNRATASL